MARKLHSTYGCLTWRKLHGLIFRGDANHVRFRGYPPAYGANYRLPISRVPAGPLRNEKNIFASSHTDETKILLRCGGRSLKKLTGFFRSKKRFRTNVTRGPTLDSLESLASSRISKTGTRKRVGPDSRLPLSTRGLDWTAQNRTGIARENWLRFVV